MSKQIPIFNTETMYQIGCGNSDSCSFDFSLIPANSFEPFFNSLPNTIYKKVAKVKFSCDGYFKDKTMGKIIKQNKEIISRSIMNNKPNFAAYLVKILGKTLPKSKSLKSIHFSHINFTTEQMKKLFKTIILNKKLESISFQHIHTEDSDFIELLSHITPYQYAEITFFDCGLTSASFNAIKKFIQQAPRTMMINRKLMIFNVDECMFTYDELEEIENMVNDAQDDKTTIDETSTVDDYEEDIPEEDVLSDDDAVVKRGLTNSASGTMKTPSSEYDAGLAVASEKLTFPKRHILTTPHLDETRVSSKKSYNSSSVSALDQEDMNTIMTIEEIKPADDLSNSEIEKQNENLRNVLKKMCKAMHVTKYSDDVFVVGKGSEEFVEVVKKLKGEIGSFK